MGVECAIVYCNLILYGEKTTKKSIFTYPIVNFFIIKRRGVNYYQHRKRYFLEIVMYHKCAKKSAFSRNPLSSHLFNTK
ncbi:hypothetical protein AMJ80_10710 [bacterium SM23_31]|nr:MAG: hypothetical protein AMJ80_10710 [bacterium SM23_31]